MPRQVIMTQTGQTGSVLRFERHDVPSDGSAMFVAASSLQNARSMHGVSGAAWERAYDVPADHHTVPASATGQVPCRPTCTVPPLQFGLQRWGVRLHLFLAGSPGVF
jgi:hypothetical protein